jgi:hypothetical protein
MRWICGRWDPVAAIEAVADLSRRSMRAGHGRYAYHLRYRHLLHSTAGCDEVNCIEMSYA